MNAYKYKLEDVKAAASGRWKEILRTVGIPAECLEGRKTPCPKCQGDDRWRFDVQQEKGVCSQCCKMTDGLGVVQWWLDLTFAQALEAVAKILGIEPQPIEKTPKKKEIDSNLHWPNYEDWQFANAVKWVCSEYGTTPELIKACGGRIATYRRENLVIAFPTMNESGLTGWYLQATTERGVPTWEQGQKEPVRKKRKATAGSKAGLLLPVGIESAREIWRVEGLSDYLAFMGLFDRPSDVFAITNTGGAKQQIQNWYLTHWQGKAAYVLGDTDKDGVEGAERWALRLAEVAESSVLVPLPFEITPTKGKDLRDYLKLGHTYADLKRLAGEAGIPASDVTPRKQIKKPAKEQAGRYVPVDSSDDVPVEYWDTAYLAEENLKRYAAKRQNGTLGFHKGGWYKYNGTTWKTIGIDDLRPKVRRIIKSIFHEQCRRAEPKPDGTKKSRRIVTAEHVRGCIHDLEELCHIPESVELNTYFDRSSDVRERRNYLRLANGILDVDAMLRDEPLETVLLPHTSHWFSTVCLPYSLDLDADCPKWHAFLERSVGDPQLINLLQEWAGYCLTYDTSHQKLLMLYGEGANGKSVILSALQALIGRDNCSTVPLEAFADRFAKTSTLGKLINISPDSGEIDRDAEGALKAFTSGDRMDFDRKNLAPISVEPTARLVISTNSKPRFADKSSGIWRRLLLMPMVHVIPESERVLGMDKIGWWEQSGELPGMLRWALAGLARLKRQKTFTVPLVSAAALEEYRDEQNPARVFLRDHTQASHSEEVETQILYAAYADWCRAHGFRVHPDSWFGKEVKRFWPHTEKQRPRANGWEGKSRKYVYSGIVYYPDGVDDDFRDDS